MKDHGVGSDPMIPIAIQQMQVLEGNEDRKLLK